MLLRIDNHAGRSYYVWMTKLVGILNITPDSFSDGGEYFDPEKAITHARQLFEEGAALIDIGAESTRPNAQPLTDEEEWARLEPVLKVLMKEYPGKLSLDTYHPATARKALAIGPIIINDITGFKDNDMLAVVGEFKPTVIASHLPGTDIQQAHQLAPVNDMTQVRDDLLAAAAKLRARGLKPGQIILDPGIGFGKSMELNGELLAFAKQVPGYEVMIGYSRKRFLGKHRLELEPNLEAGRVATQNGAAYLRVHDVAGHAGLIR